MKNKVLVTGTSVSDELLTPLRDAGLHIENPVHLLSEDELTAELDGAVAYLLGGDEIATRRALEAAKELKVVAFLGVGYESFIDVKAAAQLGIPVTNTPGTLTDSVAEFTVGQLINANRRLTEYVNLYRSGGSGQEEKQRDLASRTVGIIGLGAIGTRIAEILRQGFNASVVYYSRTRKPETEDRLGVTYVDLHTLAESSSAIVVMTPGNDSTRGLVDSSVLSAVQPGSLLVNTARPEVVDANALHAALSDGRVGVAVVDGFYEGAEGAKLLADFGPDRLLVTGHIASLTTDARDGMARKAVSSILNILNSGTDEYIVVPPARG